MKKSILILVSMIIVLASIVTATADVTYTFSRNNVDVKIYNCADSDCASVTGWSWTGSTTNGQITIPFPAALQSPYYGYAMYFVSSGYIPKEGKATWHCTSGNQCSGDGNNGDPLVFNKIAMCRGVVDSFSVTNYASPELPLIVDMLAELDADVHSAFRPAFPLVEYVPPSLKDRYYSADTRLDLEIRNLDTNQVVQTYTAYYTEANGNPIFMDSYDTFYYEWESKKLIKLLENKTEQFEKYHRRISSWNFHLCNGCVR